MSQLRVSPDPSASDPDPGGEGFREPEAGVSDHEATSASPPQAFGAESSDDP